MSGMGILPVDFPGYGTAETAVGLTGKMPVLRCELVVALTLVIYRPPGSVTFSTRAYEPALTRWYHQA